MNKPNEHTPFLEQHPVCQAIAGAAAMSAGFLLYELFVEKSAICFFRVLAFTGCITVAMAYAIDLIRNFIRSTFPGDRPVLAIVPDQHLPIMPLRMAARRVNRSGAVTGMLFPVHRRCTGKAREDFDSQLSPTSH